MADLAPLTYGTVTGRFLAIIGDTADGLEDPDAVPLVGTVTITPDLPYGLVINALPVPATILPRPVQITLDANGYIEWGGNDYIKLLATDDGNVNPTNFTYTASFELTLDGVSIPYGPFSFQLPGGTTVDLTTVAPLASTPGTLTVAGPQGPPGPTGPAGTIPEYADMTVVDALGSTQIGHVRDIIAFEPGLDGDQDVIISTTVVGDVSLGAATAMQIAHVPWEDTPDEMVRQYQRVRHTAGPGTWDAWGDWVVVAPVQKPADTDGGPAAFIWDDVMYSAAHWVPLTDGVGSAGDIVMRGTGGVVRGATPVGADDLTTKAYVDGRGEGIKDYGTGTTAIDAITSNEVGWVTINDMATFMNAAPINGTTVRGLVVSMLSDYSGDTEFAIDAELFQTIHASVDSAPYQYTLTRRRVRTGGVWGAFGSWTAQQVVWKAPDGGSLGVMVASHIDEAAGFSAPPGSWLSTSQAPLSLSPLNTTWQSRLAMVSHVQLGDIFGAGYESGAVFAQDNAAPVAVGTVPAAVVTGTATNYDVTSRTGADRATRFARYDYVAAAASTTAVAGVTYPLALTLDNGFMIRFRFAVTGGITAATRLFAGLILSNTMSDVEPDTLLSMCGIGYKSADTNFTWYSNDATLATAGASASTTAVSTTPSQIVDVLMSAEAGAGSIRCIARINTAGTMTTTSFNQGTSSQRPATSDALHLMLRASAGGTSAQPVISLLSMQYTDGLF